MLFRGMLFRGSDHAIYLPNIEGMGHNLRVYPEQNGGKAPPDDVRKFLDLSYLNDALAELGKR